MPFSVFNVSSGESNCGWTTTDDYCGRIDRTDVDKNTRATTCNC